MSETVNIAGLKELDAALVALPESLARAVLRRVLAKAAAPILEDAKSRALSRPADAPAKYFGRGATRKLRRPGTDRFLVQAGARLTRNQARLARKEGKFSAEYYVGTRDRIGRLLEFGTIHMPAHPIFRPAWEGHKREALSIIVTELRNDIEKTRARLAARIARAANNG